MKKSHLTFAALLLIATACTKEVNTANETVSADNQAVPTEPSAPAPATETDDDTATDGTYCYLHASNRDSMKVKLQIAGSSISGDLERIPFEKDRAKGTFTGTKRADGKFDVDYKYMQEGMDQNAKLIFDVDRDELEIENDPVYNASLDAVACK